MYEYDVHIKTYDGRCIVSTVSANDSTEAIFVVIKDIVITNIYKIKCMVHLKEDEI